MKSLLVLFILAFNVSAGEILLMDTLEFQTVQHTRGKREYLKSLVPLLRELKLKDGNFDASKVDQHDLYELILKDEAWSPIVKAADKACEDKRNARICKKIGDLRISTFEFVKKNPENNED